MNTTDKLQKIFEDFKNMSTEEYLKLQEEVNEESKNFTRENKIILSNTYMEAEMKIKELFRKYSFEEVFPHIQKLHREYKCHHGEEANRECYRIAFEQIKKTKPAKQSIMIVCLDYREDGNRLYAVMKSRKHHYSICCKDWSEWLVMNIDPKSIARFPGEYFLAHVVFEMTYHGHYRPGEKNESKI